MMYTSCTFPFDPNLSEPKSRAFEATRLTDGLPVHHLSAAAGHDAQLMQLSSGLAPLALDVDVQWIHLMMIRSMMITVFLEVFVLF